MASEKWAGFTDEDIERIKTNPTNRKNLTFEKNRIFTNKNSGPLKIEEIASKTVRDKDLLSDSSEDVASNTDPELRRKPHQLKKVSRTKELSEPNRTAENNINNSNKSPEKCASDLPDNSGISNEILSKENNGEKKLEKESNLSMTELELFELRQKRIEAENARRRALINKAITDKRMQTQAEAVKLAKISHELNRLDSILSADVAILRDYIEEASLEFSKAEKRYLKAEKEFIDAKFELYEKMQRKEQLTEHLCAIIEQNENRKANKLVELMKQLEMETLIEDCDIKESEPILSKLCHLNDEKYHCCQTLKPSQKTTSDVACDSPNGQTQNLEAPMNSMENENFGSEKST